MDPTQNPYSAPDPDAAAPGADQLYLARPLFSWAGADTINKMAKWMRFVGIAQIVLGALCGLALVFLFVGPAGSSMFGLIVPLLIILVVLGAALIFAGTWLLSAARDFRDGIVHGMTAFARGFRHLRRYFILYAVLAALGLLSQLLVLSLLRAQM